MKTILWHSNFLLILLFLSLSLFLPFESLAYQSQNMASYDKTIINEVISLAKDKVGLEYVWGGKGEVMTLERLDELMTIYGSDYYPLEKSDYIGQQAFDCSGLTYWAYEQVTGVKIGYSTIEQKEKLRDYKVDTDEIQPGDLIFTPGHVVLYTGNGKMINASSKKSYPRGGIKEEYFSKRKNYEVYRPIEYIKNIR